MGDSGTGGRVLARAPAPGASGRGGLGDAERQVDKRRYVRENRLGLLHQGQVMTMLIEDVRRQTATPTAVEGHRGVQRVLVAFDGSAGAWAALAQGIEVAATNRALLTIAAVVEEPSCFVGLGPAAAPVTRESLRRDIEAAMRRCLAAARDEVPATVSVTTQLLHGKPARALAACAVAGRYDLVVTGPRPACRWSRLLRRSVTHALLSRCDASVLAVRTA
jgi:nucleotide-binding universal stress UspA family protein